MAFPLPRTSFNNMRKIIEAAYISKKENINTSEWSKYLGGKTAVRQEITGCLNFFLEIGLLEQSERPHYQITEDCKQLGEAIHFKDETKEIKIWRLITENTPFFKDIIEIIRFSENNFGYIEAGKLKEEIIKLSGKEKESNTDKHFFEVFASTIINLLKRAKIIENINKLKMKLYHKPYKSDFISSDYIDQLEKIDSEDFDLSRLIRYCTQINDNYSDNNFETVAFLSRAIIHHIPPIFNQKNFESVGSQSASGKDPSFKKSCSRLQNSLKHIVDDLIHAQITKAEIPISREEIDFSQDLNRLIRGIIAQLRIQSQRPKTNII